MGRTSSQNFWRGINLDVTSISLVVVEESEGHSLNPGEFHEASLRMTHSRGLRHCGTSTSNSPELSPLPGAAEQLNSMVESAP